MIETYYEAAQRTVFRIVLPELNSANEIDKNASLNPRTWEIGLRMIAQGVALDKEDRIVVLIQGQERKIGRLDLLDFLGYLKAARGIIPFGIIIDKEELQIFAIDSEDFPEPVCVLKVVDILYHYDPEIVSKQQSPYALDSNYLSGMIESWLRDLAYNWLSEIPPALEQMKAIGLLPMLAGGSTQSDVEIRIDILHRN